MEASAFGHVLVHLVLLIGVAFCSVGLLQRKDGS